MMYDPASGYCGYGGTMGGWLGGLLMLAFSALFIAGVVLLVIWAVRASSGRGQSAGPPNRGGMSAGDDAVAVARRRLASGEISTEQYEEIMRVLGG